MKRMSKIFMMLGIASLVAFTACKKNDATVADATINITASPSGSTISAGTLLTLTVEFAGNADNKLKLYSVTSSQATSPIATGTLSGTIGNVIVKDTPATGLVVYTVTLTSDKGTVTKSYTVTVSGSYTIMSTTPFDLGNQVSTSPKFWSAKRDQTFNLSDAKGNTALQADADFAYCTRSSTNGGNKLIAPASQDATDIYATQWGNDTNTVAVSERITNWATRNATMFIQTSITETTFQNAATDAAIEALIATARAAGEPNVSSIGVTGSTVYLFKTATGAYGLIDVVSATGSYTTATQTGSAQIITKYQKQ